MIYKNGSEEVIVKRQSLTIKNCPCEDGKTRTVLAYQPVEMGKHSLARTKVNGRTVSGFLILKEDGYKFVAKLEGKNSYLLVNFMD